jgi:hypothetical protein
MDKLVSPTSPQATRIIAIAKTLTNASHILKGLLIYFKSRNFYFYRKEIENAVTCSYLLKREKP